MQTDHGGGDWKLARALTVCLLLLAESALFILDARLGNLLPLTALYIALLYFAQNRTGGTWTYLLALAAAAGRTWAACQGSPHLLPPEFIVEQFAGSLSVLGLTCYLLERRGRLPSGEGTRPGSLTPPRNWPRWSNSRHLAPLTLASLGFLAAFVPKVDGAVTRPPYQMDPQGRYLLGNPETALGPGTAGLRTKAILLTVDDGPADAEADAAILDTLQRHHARSIWFVTCREFDPLLTPQAAGNARTLRRLALDGQLIANHGYNHLSMVDLQHNPQRVRSEISRCSSAIDAATGQRPRYFRAPYGEFTAEALRAAGENGLNIVRWNMSYDSIYGFNRSARTQPLPVNEAAMQHFVDSLESGDIVMLHDDRRTAASFDHFLSSAEARGFGFWLPDGGTVTAPRAGDPRAE